MTTTIRTRAARPRVDATLAAAQDVARAAAEDAAPGGVGAHEGVEADAERVVTHYFACLQRAYSGWRWAVTLARAPRARHVTVDEVVLLPGPGALLPPEWLPWSERLRPGDVGIGDLLVTAEDDERLVPGYAALPDVGAGTEDDDAGTAAAWAGVDPALHWELGLGRIRVLSPEGREQAVERWYDGPAGPAAKIARAAPEPCSTCGFWWPLAGGLRQVFGVCANSYAPDDGRVVAVDHGCGAHSEVAVAPSAAGSGDPVVDEIGYDMLPPAVAPDGQSRVETAAPSNAADAADEADSTDVPDPATATPATDSTPAIDSTPATPATPATGHPPGSVDASEPTEELGHS